MISETVRGCTGWLGPVTVSTLTDDRGLQVDEDGSGHELAALRLVEERLAAVAVVLAGLQAHAVLADVVLHAVELPAG